MSEEKTVKEAKEIVGLSLVRMSFQRESYYNEESPWRINATFEGKTGYNSGMKEMRIEVDGTIAQEIVKLLAPVIVQQASKEADTLANKAKELAAVLGDKMVFGISDAAPTTPPTETNEPNTET